MHVICVLNIIYAVLILLSVWRGNLKAGINLEDLGANGKIILKRDFKDVGWEDVYWI